MRRTPQGNATKMTEILACVSLRQLILSWASAHRGKWGQLTPPGKMDEKLKSQKMQKEQFSVFMLYFESNQGRQV